MNRIFIISILLCLFSSCREAEETFSKEELAKKDSLALHVAVFPTLETLPFYYAERSGMLDEAEADIRLMHYESMMDCDTAITRGHAQVSVTDVARIITLQQKDTMALTAIASLESRMGLYSPKKKKINRIEQLKERLIGMERHSRSDYWSDHILEGTDLTTLDIFRVQIGSTHLRYDMLMSELLDAAFLSEPYASLCGDTLIAHCLWQQPDSLPRWEVLAVPAKQQQDSLRTQQVKALMKVYERARLKIVAHPDTALLHKIYREDYLIPERHLQRVHWYEWKPAPLTDSISPLPSQQASEWLERRSSLMRDLYAQ